MNNNLRLWEKNKDYFLTGVNHCYECNKPLKQVAIVMWLDKNIGCFHIDCYKKQKNFRYFKSVIIATLVEEVPKGCVFVSRPFEYLLNSNQLNNDFFQEGVKIIDKTVYANRESLEGASVSVPLLEQSADINDIDAFLLDVKNSVPLVQEEKVKRLEKQ